MIPSSATATHHYLDYKTLIGEVERELRKDLARADDEGDRMDALAEYEAELADAEKDFRKEMAERGTIIPKGRVTIEPEVAAMLHPTRPARVASR